jgi:hypothetical protein
MSAIAASGGLDEAFLAPAFLIAAGMALLSLAGAGAQRLWRVILAG